jgi:hypothetical protein
VVPSHICHSFEGSRDSQLALWKVDNLDSSELTEAKSLQFPEYVIKKPEVVKLCDKAEKVRALCFDNNRKVRNPTNFYINVY